MAEANVETIPIIQVTGPSYNTVSNDDRITIREDTSESGDKSNRTTNMVNNDREYLLTSNRNDKFSTKSETGSAIQTPHKRSKFMNIMNIFKICILVVIIFLSMIFMAFIDIEDGKWVTFATKSNKSITLDVTTPILGYINVQLKGPFIPSTYEKLTSQHMKVGLGIRCVDGNNNSLPSYELVTSYNWVLAVPDNNNAYHIHDSIEQKVFDIRYLPQYCGRQKDMQYTVQSFFLRFKSNTTASIPFSVQVTTYTEQYANGALYSGLIFLGLYVLIGFELIHRTLAAIIASTVSIMVLTILNKKPELEEIITWLDVETLVLIFSMMVLVAIFCETGFFDYVAVLAYRLAKGRQWPLITTLCLVTGIISAFLDNVTTILLITPITIRLCEVMGLDPRHVLVCIVLFSNIGGTATPIGDPPNVIIISNEKIIDSGIDFLTFTTHVGPGAILCLITGYIFMRLYYMRGQMSFTDPPDVVDLKHEIDVWKRAYNSLPGYTHEEDVVRDTLGRKIAHLEKVLHKKKLNKVPNEGEYRAISKELQEKYKIKNKTLLINSGVIILAVLVMFICTSIPGFHLTLGWIALFGAIILLIIADLPEIEGIFARVEWTTLIFFSALFVLTKAVEKLGLLKIISAATESFITKFEPENQLIAAILLILWVSAIASTFIDNIPFTTAMIPVIGDMADNTNLPLQPLVWALAFGACLGGNGSLIGASANVVCAGISENHGYRFTFVHFFKIGFPMMLVTSATATVYLLICHSAFEWNY